MATTGLCESGALHLNHRISPRSKIHSKRIRSPQRQILARIAICILSVE